MAPDDLDRLKAFYQHRDVSLSEGDLYSLFNKSYLFTMQQRTRNVLDLLHSSGFQQLSEHRILEVGCGQGGVLLEYISFGANEDRLHGCDLLPNRVQKAREKLPAGLSLTIANGQSLPYKSHSFDLVMQYTVFSSILSDAIKHDLATEMLRVLRPGGMILWYDFWLNPTNPQTKGIRPSEIKCIFPDCRVKAHKITLAPPLARVLVPVSWFFCIALEKLKILNTHYLATITPNK